jgi:hypothetical protein
MKKIQHQFYEEAFYEPTWEIKHLLLGTFNPLGGEKVNYYFGRSKNQTWPTLSLIFNCLFTPANSGDFIKLIKAKQIACLDLIDEIEVPDSLLQSVFGKGYKDSVIINNTVIRKYNTARIEHIIKKNPGVHIYSTWGKGPSLLDWTSEVSKLGKLVNLVSPSLAARVPKGTRKIPYIINDWKGKIKPF